VNETVDKAHKSIKNIRAFNKKLSAFKTVYGDRKDDGIKVMLIMADTMKTKFEEVEKALYQTKNRSGQDPLNFPIKLTNKLAHLNSLVTMGDFGPTSQDTAVKNELTAQINDELDKFNLVLDTDIKEFNQKFNALKLDYLVIEKED
jgi:endonuclease/exonuclease/phosphatase family metal-dependent hydrolase